MLDPMVPTADLRFLLHEWLRAGERSGFGEGAALDREVVDTMLELARDAASNFFLPAYKLTDVREPLLENGDVRVPPEVRKALREYAELGFSGLAFPEQLGGLGASYLVWSACFALFASAHIAIAAYPMLSAGNARLIVTFGNAEQVERYAKPQIAGSMLGTMALSEPQAGSSLADVTCRAVPDGEDGLGRRYRISGSKMWISGGDHDITENIVHLVLAKIPDPAGQLSEGTEGISLFVVPKVLVDGSRNDVVTAGLNHKMGYRGTTNCLLNLGDSEGALGWLVGTAGRGLAQMFQMMNEARIGVGLGAAALAYRGYRHSLIYAHERPQGRLTGVRSGPPVAIVRHADVRRMLLKQKSVAEGALALCLYCADLVDRSDDPSRRALLELLTPVAKTWPSEHGLAANDAAIQVHGGYGYTRDFDVEQVYRDNRLNPIHEGTTGIQAIDLLGRKVLGDGGERLAILAGLIRATSIRAKEEDDLASMADALIDALRDIEAAVESMARLPASQALALATPFLMAFGHLVVAWIWLDVALAALPLPRTDVSAGKLRACRYFYDVELPCAAAWLSPVARGDPSIFDAGDDEL